MLLTYRRGNNESSESGDRGASSRQQILLVVHSGCPHVSELLVVLVKFLLGKSQLSPPVTILTGHRTSDRSVLHFPGPGAILPGQVGCGVRGLLSSA